MLQPNIERVVTRGVLIAECNRDMEVDVSRHELLSEIHNCLVGQETALCIFDGNVGKLLRRENARTERENCMLAFGDLDEEMLRSAISETLRFAKRELHDSDLQVLRRIEEVVLLCNESKGHDIEAVVTDDGLEFPDVLPQGVEELVAEVEDPMAFAWSLTEWFDDSIDQGQLTELCDDYKLMHPSKWQSLYIMVDWISKGKVELYG